MTTMVVHSANATAAAAMTVGRLRDLLDDLADDTPLHIGVYGHQHFNTVLGTMPVTSARVEPIPQWCHRAPVRARHLVSRRGP